MDMGVGGPEMGAEPGPVAGADLDTDSDFDTDEFGATDAAAGGEEELGRERR
jgi:hypothetical protein